MIKQQTQQFLEYYNLLFDHILTIFPKLDKKDIIFLLKLTITDQKDFKRLASKYKDNFKYYAVGKIENLGIEIDIKEI